MSRAGPELSEEAEDGFAPISGLNHVVYCPRRAALVHVEQQWADDAATRAGSLLHERADSIGTDHRRGVRVLRSVSLVSRRLALRGRADFVELHPSATGAIQPVPVEMKVSKRKHERADRVQLCAQAMCLEEMWTASIPEGVLYYDGSHRRVTVSLDAQLRAATEAAIRELHRILFLRVVPAPEPGPKCRKCAQLPLCLPYTIARPERARRWLTSLMRVDIDDEAPAPATPATK